MFSVSIPTDILRYKLFIFLGYVDFTRASWACTELYRHWQYAKSKIPLDCVYIPEHRSLTMVDCVRVLKNHSLTANLLFVQDHPTLTTVLVDDGLYNIEYPLRNVSIIGSKQTEIAAWEHGLQVEGDCCIYGIALRPHHIWGETSFSLNNIQSQQMCDGFWYHVENHTARDLYALYQREHTFKTLSNNIIAPTKFAHSPFNRGIMHSDVVRQEKRNEALEQKIMDLKETPPHLFDISKYRQPPGDREKQIYRHPMNLYPDYGYFITMVDRPFLKELHARWQTKPLYAWPDEDENYKKRKAEADIAIEAARNARDAAARNVSMTDACLVM